MNYHLSSHCQRKKFNYCTYKRKYEMIKIENKGSEVNKIFSLADAKYLRDERLKIERMYNREYLYSDISLSEYTRVFISIREENRKTTMPILKKMVDEYFTLNNLNIDRLSPVSGAIESGSSYEDLQKRITKIKKSYPDMSTEVAGDLALEMLNENFTNKNSIKFIHVYELCNIDNLNLMTVLENETNDTLECILIPYYKNIIEKCIIDNKIEINKEFTDEIIMAKLENPINSIYELIELKLKDYDIFINLRYLNAAIFKKNIITDGKTIDNILNENDFTVKKFVNRFNNIRREYKNESQSNLIKLTIGSLNGVINGKYKYEYNGVSVYKLCKIEEINYIELLNSIDEYKNSNSDLNVDEIVKIVLELEYEKKIINYINDLILLNKNCVINKLNPDEVVRMLIEGKRKRPKSSIVITLQEMVHKNKMVRKKKKSEYINNEPISNRLLMSSDFGEEVDYSEVESYMDYYSVFNIPYNKVYGMAINKYKNDIELVKQKEMIENIDCCNQFNEDDKIFEFVNLDSVKVLIESGIEFKSAIKMVYYFGKECDNEISMNINQMHKLNKVFEICENNPENLPVYILDIIYKSGFYDVKNILMEKLSKIKSNEISVLKLTVTESRLLEDELKEYGDEFINYFINNKVIKDKDLYENIFKIQLKTYLVTKIYELMNINNIDDKGLSGIDSYVAIDLIDLGKNVNDLKIKYDYTIQMLRRIEICTIKNIALKNVNSNCKRDKR